MENPLSDSDVQAQGSKFNANIHVLDEASNLLWYIWRNIDPAYSRLRDCIAALEEDPELYQALKDAHALGQYDVIRQWKKSSVHGNISYDSKVEKIIGDLLQEIRPMMQRLVMGDVVLPTWSPPEDSVDAGMASHLASLKIPCLGEKPNLLLHDLGSFAREVELERRLKNIFKANYHTFLVNTSGSGKTRLLLEGLCENWGFYFTSLVDSSYLGSSDVQNSIGTHIPDAKLFRKNLPPPGSPGYDASLTANRDIANRVFRQIFLSRLIIFCLFTETMSEFITTHEDAPKDPRVFKTRWLLLQLQPSFLHPTLRDMFDNLSANLAAASDSYINERTKALLNSTRRMCSRLQAEGSSTSAQTSSLKIAPIPFFCVLDEAHHAATQHISSFRSEQNGTHRPILREILKAWEGQSSGQGVFMVVAGTGIPKDVVDQAMFAAVMKDSKYRWCSDTGAFDTRPAQQRYLQKYLPKSFLASKSGIRLLERIWYWLHGRYRFTTGYMVQLLLNGFKRPHGLLNAYVQHFANFAVTDAPQFVQNEGTEALPIMSQYRLDFSKLKRNSNMLSTIHQSTTHYLMRSVLPVPLGKDEAIYVEYGFARFVDAETQTVAVDEPLVLLAATNWFNCNDLSSYKFFAKQIQHHETESHGFENYIAYCFDLLFSHRRPIKDIFQFNGAPPSWSNLEAELVALRRTDISRVEENLVSYSKGSGPSLTLGTNAKSLESTLSWLAHDSHSPICFPHTSMGPDLLFVLRLSDKSLIWVAVQVKYSSENSKLLPKEKLRHAMRSVTPRLYFLDKEGKRFSSTSHPSIVDDTTRHLLALPHRRNDAGKFSLLRVVVSFPADTDLKRCLPEDPDTDGHPIASLDMALVKKVTKSLSPTGFLQKLEGSPPTSKRKRSSDIPGKRTKKRV